MKSILRIPPFASTASTSSLSSSSSSASSNVAGALPSGVLKYSDDDWRRTPSDGGNRGDCEAAPTLRVVLDSVTVVLPVTANALLHINVVATVHIKRRDRAVAVVIMVKLLLFSFFGSPL